MGLELVRTVDATRIVRDERLQLRVGISSGLVAVVKSPTSPKGEIYGGLTIDLAERFRSVAEPGQVIIGDATKRLAAGYFLYRDLGLVKLKGFEEGVRAWQATGEFGIVSRFEARRLDPSRMEIVGRGAELNRLAEVWVAARNGHGGSVCLLGEAGIGKSRLAQAVLSMAVADGAFTFRIDCMPSTGNTPLYPVGVALRRILGIGPSTPARKRRQALRKLLSRLTLSNREQVKSVLAPLVGFANEQDPTASPLAQREQSIATIVGVLASLAAEGPLVLLCEDVHWIDDTTLQILARFCEIAPSTRAMVIMTRRPAVAPLLVDMPSIETIPLSPLMPSQAGDFVRTIARGVEMPKNTIERIVVRCEGVPLVLEEVTRTLLEQGSQPDDIVLASTAEEQIPAPLQLVIQSRLDRWPEFAPVVQAASVLGREFSLSILGKVMPDRPPAALLEAVELMTSEGLFENGGANGAHRSFKHVMICDAVYNTLLGAHRQRLHSRIADLLLGDPEASLETTPDTTAVHLLKSKRVVEAVETYLQASQDTSGRGAFVESEGHCAAALAQVDSIEDTAARTRLQFLLLIQRGVAQTGRHGYSAATVEETYRSAQAVCGDSAGAEMLYPIMRGLATVNLVRGDLATAYDLSVRNLELAEQSKRVEFRIDALSVLCYTTLYYGRLEDCRRLISECLDLYRAEHGERLSYPVPQDAATAAIALLPTVAWLLGDSDAAEAAIQDGIAHVERLDRNFDRALLHAWIAGARYTQRRYAQALEHASIAIAIANEHGFREWSGTGMLMALLARAATSADSEAISLATELSTAFSREGVGLNASYYLWALARGHLQAGDRSSAGLLIGEAFKAAEQSHETRMNAELMILQSEVEEDVCIVRDLLGRALSLSREHGAVATALRAAALLQVRDGSPGDTGSFAAATIDMLDGREAFPAGQGWMAERLAAIEAARAANGPLRKARREEELAAAPFKSTPRLKPDDCRC